MKAALSRDFQPDPQLTEMNKCTLFSVSFESNFVFRCLSVQDVAWFFSFGLLKCFYIWLYKFRGKENCHKI